MAFRINARKFALTYPQCDADPSVVILNTLKAFGADKLDYVVVGQEKHSDGELHLHIGMKFTLKKSISNQSTLDALCGKHGNYQAMRNETKWLAYVIKGGNFRVWPDDFDVKRLIELRLRRVNPKSVQVSDMIKAGKSIEDIDELHGGYLLEKMGKVKTYMEMHAVKRQRTAQRAAMPDFMASQGISIPENRIRSWLAMNFNDPPEADELNLERHQALYIWGETALGKSLMVDKLKKYLVMYKFCMDEDWVDGFADQMFDFAYMDDFKGNFTVQFMNRWIDPYDVVLKARYAHVTRTKWLPTILTSNCSPHEWYLRVRERSSAVWHSYIRRMYVVHVEEFIGDMFE